MCSSSWLGSKEEGCQLALPGLWHLGEHPDGTGRAMPDLSLAGHFHWRHWESWGWAHGLGDPMGRAPGSADLHLGQRETVFLCIQRRLHRVVWICLQIFSRR